MHRSPAFLLLGVLAITPVRAQERPSLESRFDAAMLAALRPILETARADSVPLRALEDKALEGAAKRVPGARIVAAVERLAAELRQARSLLRGAAPAAPISDGEIIAAAAVLRRGVAATEIAALRRDVPAATDLEIPFAVLGALVERGVPLDEARAVLEHLVASGASQERLVQILERMDAALRLGAPPVPALGSALAGLGIPVPPVQPPQPRPDLPAAPKPDR